MKVQSASAMVASLLGLAANALLLFFFIALFPGTDGDAAIWVALVVLFLALPFFLALGAAYSDIAALRTTTLTAAFVAAVPPTYLMLFYFFGIVLVPGVAALLVAAIRNRGSLRPAAKVGSVVCGTLSGVILALAWWPIVVALGYDGGLANQGVMAGLTMAFVAVTCVWLAGTALGKQVPN